MPRLDGLQAARTIRAVSKAPIILFTLYADAISSREILSAGIDAVVSKVGDLSLLAAQINLLLGADGIRATFDGRPH